MKVHLDIKHSCAFKIPILARVFLRPWLALSQRVAVRVPIKKICFLIRLKFKSFEAGKLDNGFFRVKNELKRFFLPTSVKFEMKISVPFLAFFLLLQSSRASLL